MGRIALPRLPSLPSLSRSLRLHITVHDTLLRCRERDGHEGLGQGGHQEEAYRKRMLVLQLHHGGATWGADWGKSKERNLCVLARVSKSEA